MTVFVVSDIHGHYHVLKKALNKAGYDETNPTHFLLCLGDLFDRGKENVKVYHYFKRLTEEQKALVLLGNHDLFMLEFLAGDFKSAEFNASYNGFNQTLEDFSGLVYQKQDLKKIYTRIQKRHPELKSWLDHLPLYLNTKDYVFTHGGIDGTNANWHKQSRKKMVWNYQSNLPGLEDKTIVVGHERTALIRLKRGEITRLNPSDPNQFSIIKENGKIFIDGFVEFSKHINVLTLDIAIETLKDASKT